MPRALFAGILLLLVVGETGAQQVADTMFAPEITAPAFQSGRGPTVFVDEAHHNFHTAGGRYLAFARLLRRDGYVVEPSARQFTPEMLREADVLVISNALAERNVEDWSLPTPSAFDEDEIIAVRDWVSEGGSLLLIADHMPIPGAAEKLAAAFGLLFINGFAFDSAQQTGTFVFRRSDESLADHPIIDGRSPAERVDSVVSFMGQAFRAVATVEPLMVVAPGTVLLMPEVAWEFSEKTPRLSAAGMFQGVALHFGRGRVAAFGEAAMFSAQVAGPEESKMGMNRPEAAQNPQFLLNVMHWLSGLLED
jgi:hypothetical protein